MEPRKFEPLTPAAVQRRVHNVVVVRRGSEVAAKQHIYLKLLLPAFAVVRLGVKLVSANTATERGSSHGSSQLRGFVAPFALS